MTCQNFSRDAEDTQDSTHNIQSIYWQ